MAAGSELEVSRRPARAAEWSNLSPPVYSVRIDLDWRALGVMKGKRDNLVLDWAAQRVRELLARF